MTELRRATSEQQRDGAVVLFDLDGTLADTTALILECFHHATQHHLGERQPEDAWLASMGRPLRVQMRAYGRDDAEVRALVDTYVEYQRVIHDGWVTAFPDAASVLTTLEERGTRVALVTSKRREMALRTLDCCGLSDRFSVMVCGDEVEHPKPDPEPVLKALAALGVDPGPHVVFLGDSPFDLRAGRAAGVGTAGAMWGPFERADLAPERPDFLLSELREILSLI